MWTGIEIPAETRTAPRPETAAPIHAAETAAAGRPGSRIKVGGDKARRTEATGTLAAGVPGQPDHRPEMRGHPPGPSDHDHPPAMRALGHPRVSAPVPAHG